MKHFTFFLFFKLTVQILWAQTFVSSKIESVTVYLSGAQILRKTELILQKGENEIVFQGLTNSIDLNSIQLTVPGVKIISILPSRTYYTPYDSLLKLQKYKDSLELYQNQLALINHEADGFKAEYKLLENNMNRIGSEKGISLPELQNFSAYYQKRISELENKNFYYNQKKMLLEKNKQRIQKRISELEALQKEAFNISVRLKSETSTKVPIILSYVALNAGWYPFYDVRVKNISEKVKFAYRASIINDTNEDWKDVKLKLSSANPTLSTEAPSLEVWRIDFKKPLAYKYKVKLETIQKSQLNTYEDAAAEEFEEEISNQTKTQGADIQISALSIEFEIKDLYTILSDGKYYSVDLNEYELQAQYIYKCVPKIDKDAFLIANIVDWEKLNLIEGKMNVYFGDTYIGDSYLSPQTASDTLRLSLGRDKKIIVKRVEIKDFSKISFIGSNKKETIATEIEVRNTNNAPVDIEIYDQIPVSKNSEIEVTLDNLGGAKYNQEKGELNWTIKLKEEENKKFRFEYTIKYPKNKLLEYNNYQSPQNQRKLYLK